MFERLFGNQSHDPAVMERIPPGQYRTEKFPVLHYGSVPSTDLAKWDFKVYGEVDSPFTLTWDQFKTLARQTVATDIHCVTRWTKLDTVWVLDYRAPEGGCGDGDFVEVPLGPRRVLGVVWGKGEGKFDPARIRAVNKVLDLLAQEYPGVHFKPAYDNARFVQILCHE